MFFLPVAAMATEQDRICLSDGLCHRQHWERGRSAAEACGPSNWLGVWSLSSNYTAPPPDSGVGSILSSFQGIPEDPPPPRLRSKYLSCLSKHHPHPETLVTPGPRFNSQIYYL